MLISIALISMVFTIAVSLLYLLVNTGEQTQQAAADQRTYVRLCDAVRSDIRSATECRLEPDMTPNRPPLFVLTGPARITYQQIPQGILRTSTVDSRQQVELYRLPVAEVSYQLPQSESQTVKSGSITLKLVLRRNPGNERRSRGQGLPESTSIVAGLGRAA